MDNCNGNTTCKCTSEANWFPNISQIKAEFNDPSFDFMFEPPYSDLSQITDNIYLTSLSGVTKSNFEEHKFQCILDFCENVHYTAEEIDHQKFAILDNLEQDICGIFNKIADKLHANNLNGTKTLVHCLAGASRSAAMVIAYLMKYHRLSLHDAFNYVRQRRFVCSPNPGFFRQLIDYEFELFGKTSTNMIKVRNEEKKLATEMPDFYVEEHKDLKDYIFWFIENDEKQSKYPILSYD